MPQVLGKCNGDERAIWLASALNAEYGIGLFVYEGLDSSSNRRMRRSARIRGGVAIEEWFAGFR